MNLKLTNEPVLVRAAIGAVVTAVVAVAAAFGIVIDLDAGKTATLVGAVATVAGLVQAILARRKVTPVTKGA